MASEIVTWLLIILAVFSYSIGEKTLDELLEEPYCPRSATCPELGCPTNNQRPTRRWLTVDLGNNVTVSGFCPGCNVCQDQCPDYTPCNLERCAQPDYSWINDVWCPLCQACNEPPEMLQQNSDCPVIGCVDPGCSHSEQQYPYRFYHQKNFCSGCPVCRETCAPHLDCPSVSNCSLTVTTYGWYMSTWCPGCPTCYSGAAPVVDHGSTVLVTVVLPALTALLFTP